MQFDSKRNKGKGVDYGVVDSNSPDLEHESLVAKTWLDANSNQLTYFGITTLMDMMKVGEIFVLFRNNHFCTALKTKEGLLTLVTGKSGSLI